MGTKHSTSDTSFTCLFLNVANCFTVLDDDHLGCHLQCCVASCFRFRVLQLWSDFGGNCVELGILTVGNGCICVLNVDCTEGVQISVRKGWFM